MYRYLVFFLGGGGFVSVQWTLPNTRLIRDIDMFSIEMPTYRYFGRHFVFR